MPLGIEVGLGPGDIVLDVDPVPPKRGTAPNFRPMSIVPKRLDGSRCHLYGGRPRLGRLCVRWVLPYMCALENALVFKGALQMSRFTLRVSMSLVRDRNLVVRLSSAHAYCCRISSCRMCDSAKNKCISYNKRLSYRSLVRRSGKTNTTLR